MIVQFRKGDAFGIAVKLFVLLLVSHIRNLRVALDNPTLRRPELPARVDSRADFHEESARVAMKSSSCMFQKC